MKIYADPHRFTAVSKKVDLELQKTGQLLLFNHCAIDRHQENDHAHIFPSKPLLSSREAGWNNIKLEDCLLPAHSISEQLLAQNAIVMFHHSMKVTLQLGDNLKDEHVEAGDIVIIPAKTRHSACWEESASFTLLFFEPEFIVRAAYEFEHPDRVELLPTFAQPDPVIYQIGLELKSKLASERQVSLMYVDSAASFLAAHLIEHYCRSNYTTKKNTSALSNRDLQQVIDYINTHFHQNLDLRELANLINISYYHFGRLFKRSTGISPYQYLTKCRLERADRLLKNTNLDIAEIAKRTGFSSHGNFCRTFHQYRSVSPKQYRQI